MIDAEQMSEPLEGWDGEHRWETCEMCGDHVRCGYCGNNCCNGGTGTLPNGEKCGCDEAYAMQGAVPCSGENDHG